MVIFTFRSIWSTPYICSRKHHNMSVLSESSTSSGAPAVPRCISWTVGEVADWIETIGFKEYRECFTSNLVSGNKLIRVTASTLPNMGITDWKHIQHWSLTVVGVVSAVVGVASDVISAEVRKLLCLEDPFWNRSITLPPRSALGLFLERKSCSGRRANQLVFEPHEEGT